MSVKINTLELENVKRIKAIKLEVTASGLTVIGGKNGQGKTSVIDAIAWALGGNKYRPSEAQRNGSVIPPHLKITLDNGMIVERSGKNSTLKVVDSTGNKSGQQLLDNFISEFALDLPKFMSMTDKEKANVLLEIIGVGDKLYELHILGYGVIDAWDDLYEMRSYRNGKNWEIVTRFAGSALHWRGQYNGGRLVMLSTCDKDSKRYRDVLIVEIEH